MHIFSIILLLTLLSSCYSYKIFPKEHQTFTYTGEKEKAFVLNPELSKEFQIFKKAGIFDITNDSLDNSAIRIRLYPIRRDYPVCGQPIIGWAITLGQLPVLFPDRYQFSFDEIHQADTIHQEFELKIARRYWFWDMFTFKKKFKQKAGQTLLASYYNN
jgi:hypothetical protein